MTVDVARMRQMEWVRVAWWIERQAMEDSARLNQRNRQNSCWFKAKHLKYFIELGRQGPEMDWLVSRERLPPCSALKTK